MSSSNYYELYIEQVLQLAQTMVIKSPESADGLNRFVTERYGDSAVDKLDPASWKYYKNISGEYHFTDTPMYVVSMDTLETILFSKETLAVHRSTARAYKYGTRAYKELVTQYPEQEILILGILHPANITRAVNSPDGTILAYPDHLVEANEYSLIPKLQEWIYGFKTRWINPAYALSDDLYPATALGIMYLNLVPAILTLRLEACKTNEAHSFHVRQYLASHGYLDQFVDQMTLKQALFFYRNIAYIERNVGKRDTFDWLVEHIMTERSLPVAEYVMRHDLTNQPEEYYPTVMFRKNPLNVRNAAGSKVHISLTELLNKEDVMARDNVIYRPEMEPEIKEVMENSLSNVVLTKVLESSVVDYSNSSPYPLEEILLNQWLSLAARDTYKTFVGITNPRTGERIAVSVKDAYVLLWYAFCKTVGIDLVTVPKFYAKRVQNDPMPSLEDMKALVNPALVPDEVLEQALALQPKITDVVSTEAFYQLCVKIQKAAEAQRRLVSAQQHAMRRGMVQNAISRIYSDCVYSLTEEEDELFVTWFKNRNIDVSGLTSLDYGSVYTELAKEATGMALHKTNSLKDLQAAMIRLLTQLSSYSVQIIGEINNTGIRKTDWTTVRVGDVDNRTLDHSRFGMLAEVLDGGSSMSHVAHMDINTANAKRVDLVKPKAVLSYQINTKVHAKDVLRFGPIRVDIANVRVSCPASHNPNSQGVIPVLGIETYLSLSQYDQQSLRDVYSDPYSSLPPPDQLNLETTIQDRDLGNMTPEG